MSEPTTPAPRRLGEPGRVRVAPARRARGPPDGRVRLPWTRVLALGVAAFAVWFLLYAPDAAAQRAGLAGRARAARSASTSSGPIAAVSRALQLSHIVSDHRPRQRPAGGEHGAHRGRARVPATPAGQGRAGAQERRHRAHDDDGAAQPEDPTAANPLRVLIVGDSLGIDLGDALQSDLANTGRGQRHARRPGEHRADPARLLQLAGRAAGRPQGAEPAGGGRHDRRQRRPGLPRPARRALHARRSGTRSTRQRVAQFMQIAGSGGATVVWVGMPPMQNPGLSTRRWPTSTPSVSSRPQAKPPVIYSARTTRSGRRRAGTRAFITNAAGQVVNVRTPDGTHITPGRRAGGPQQVVIAELQPLGYKV